MKAKREIKQNSSVMLTDLDTGKVYKVALTADGKYALPGGDKTPSATFAVIMMALHHDNLNKVRVAK